MGACKPGTPGSWNLVPIWGWPPPHDPKIVTDWMDETPYHKCVCCEDVMDATDGVSRNVYLFIPCKEALILVCEECFRSDNRKGFHKALWKINKDYKLGLPLKDPGE